jgi:hypothetical protein
VPEEKQLNVNNIVLWISVIGMVLIGSIAAGVYFLTSAGSDTTAQVRDIFIIILALESLLIGIALIILVIQLAIFTNLIQNEVKPIIASTKETVGTLKGASKFISKRAVAPIISITSFAAGIRKLFDIVGFVQGKKHKQED